MWKHVKISLGDPLCASRSENGPRRTNEIKCILVFQSSYKSNAKMLDHYAEKLTRSRSIRPAQVWGPWESAAQLRPWSSRRTLIWLTRFFSRIIREATRNARRSIWLYALGLWSILECIEADHCKHILNLQHPLRSTIFAHVCTAPFSKFSENSAIYSPKFGKCRSKFAKF